MKHFPKIILLLVLISCFSGCNLNSKEIIELRNEIRYLETELSSVQGSPGYLFGEAFEHVDAEDYAEAVNLLNELKINFPEWNKKIVEEYINNYSKLVKK
ncbi:MAG: hypothetical protein CVV23_04625 [Ignavibacteriae bacterium HGW-Ignavibacteriae-2]|nr:hypothetical protein [Bacteroidota bacterium]PKL89503.1 MAG: hypothetical protein CVV23_04625 [Ignavibacteriae bacterium HGW-Ignavibacteriae-2]